MVIIQWDGGMTKEQEGASTDRQWERVKKALRENPEWAAFDPDDGTGSIVVAPAETTGLGRKIEG